MSENSVNPSKNSDPNQVIKVWFFRSIKALSFFAIVLGFYLIYLDAWVQERMSGPKWDAPVKVYSRPLTLYPRKFLPKYEVIAELQLMGYEKHQKITKPGQFAVNGSSLEIYRKAFTFIKGEEKAGRFKVDFDAYHVQNVERYFDGQWQVTDMLTLDPMLISRQVNAANEDREIINLADVPEWMIDTLLVVEDRNFYHHHGVSPLAIARALWVNLNAGRKVQGGSTLTQQLAKNLLLNDNRKSYIRKAKEALVALILDYRFSKDSILEAYFNEIYLGQDGSRAIHGFALASKFYFNKSLPQLELEEFALLTAMVKGPSYYSPTRQTERARERRDLVLQLMVSENVIDRDEYQQAVDLPLIVDMQETKGRSQFASYMQLVERELKQLQLGADAERGLLVFTGLDPLLQNNYQKLFPKSIKGLEHKYKLKDVNGAAVSVDLDNGAVTALVGDRNTKMAGFNRALDANRNIGSLIKPAIYLTALNQSDYYWGSKVANTPVAMKNNRGNTWNPENFDKSESESVLLFDALTKSLNLPTVHLGMELGLNRVINTMRQLGAEHKIDKYPSLLLGATAMSPLDVAKMYQPIASFGQKSQISALTHITDPNGLLLWQKSRETEEVAPYWASYELVFGLNQVTRVGTAKRLGMYYPKMQYGGKTGTTDDLRDSWFAGFDQNRLSIVWIGKDDNSPVELTGSQGALTTFIDLQPARKAQSIYHPQPAETENRYIDRVTGEVLEDDCGEFLAVPIQSAKIKQVKDCPSLLDWFKG